MHTAPRIAVGVVLVCALVLIARQMRVPDPLPPRSPIDPNRLNNLGLTSSPRRSGLEVRPTTDEAPLARRCLILAESDPLAAMEMALAHDLCAADPGLLGSLLLRWAGEDLNAAYEWTKSRESSAWRDDFMARLGYVLARDDPASAALIVVRDIPPGPRREEAMLSVLHQWALRAPGQARAWADTFAEDPLRQRADAELEGLGRAGP